MPAKFNGGDVVRCTGPTTPAAKYARLRKGELYIVVKVEEGICSSLLCLRRPTERGPIWQTALFPQKDFELVRSVDEQSEFGFDEV